MPVYCNKCGKANKDQAKFCFSCGAKMSEEILPDKTLSLGSMLENRYKIQERIKKGGMGAVYKAFDTKLNCVCAVKELLPSFGSPEEKEQATDWFQRETRLLANLDHTNLPKVSDYFVTNNNRYYLVMNFIEGEDLESKLETDGNPGLKQEKVFEWATQLLIVLDYLHNQDPPIIYRDMKPANVMIHKDGRAMLIDFGIARALQQDSTTQTIIGTLLYTPLEQLQGKAEPRSDLYALGATMHHILSGIEPVPLMGFESLKNYNPEIFR